MAHQGQATHRRMLAHSDRHPQPPSPSMDHHPSHRQPSKSKPKPIHPVPDPPPTTIQSISHRFSKLYANHKKLIVSKPSQDNSQCTILTKSSSHHERNHHTQAESKPKLHLTRRESAKNLIPKTLEIEDEGPELNKGIPQVQLGVGMRRKSFCSSQSELADFLFCTGVKVVAVDMPPFMQIHAVDCARKTLDSLEKFTSKTLAFTLKKEFDGVYGPAWHCIVGTSFGSFVTHSVGGFMYFSVDQKLYVLLFKTTVQRADQ